MQIIANGDQRKPLEIAKFMDLLGAKDIDLRAIVREVLQEKWVPVNKIKRLGEREGPIMELVKHTIKKIGRDRDQ